MYGAGRKEGPAQGGDTASEAKTNLADADEHTGKYKQCIEKIYKPIEIPEQIRSIDGARFILIEKEPNLRKKPREKGFLTD